MIHDPGEKELLALVNAEIDAAIARKEAVRKEWLVMRVVERNAKGDESDFLLACAFYAVKSIVGHVLRSKKGEEVAENPQLVFEGYDRVQSHYQVDRDGPCIVPTELLSSAELRAKANELRAMAAGLSRHADQLDRLADEREETGQ